MKFTLHTAFPTQSSSESLWILVDSEQLQQNLNSYQINHLEDVLNATQFKAGFNENIALIIHCYYIRVVYRAPHPDRYFVTLRNQIIVV